MKNSLKNYKRIFFTSNVIARLHLGLQRAVLRGARQNLRQPKQKTPRRQLKLGMIFFPQAQNLVTKN
jgi:hypothetical protein